MKKSILLLLLFILLFIRPGFSQVMQTDSALAVTDTLRKDIGLFSSDNILHLALRFDIREYTNKKPKEEYINAVLTYFLSETDSINKNVKLKSRGVMRNGYCNFPPLLINLGAEKSKNGKSGKIEKIKIVTHCNYGNERYLFMEYLVYRLFNVMTDYSFRVRLARIDYISSTGKGKTVNTYCFLIEPLNILAERIGATPVESTTLTQQHIIPEVMDRIAIFNYMIGNTDWSVPGQHNCKILTGNDMTQPEKGLCIPYDFDYSGLVNTEYAVPYEGLGLKSVLERRYLGPCRPREEYIEALKEFTAKRAQMYSVINDFTLLNEKTRKEMTRYLDQFFVEVEKGNRAVNNFATGCYKFNN